MENDNVKMKKWPLWLKWGVGLLIINLVINVVDFFLISDWSSLGFLIAILNSPASQISYSVIDILKPVASTGIIIEFAFTAFQYFLIGVAIGLIIQKSKNRKAV